MNSPEISILIANYNKADFLPATLESIQNQVLTDWECIIVDDGSSDCSLEILLQIQQTDPRFRIFTRPNHLPKGANSCRNLAYSKSKGKFIQWFDSDDLMLPHFLKMKHDYLQDHPEKKFVVSKGEVRFDKEYKGNRKFAQSLYSENLIEDYLKFRLVFFTPGPMFRKEVFEEVGLFNPKLSRHQEWELFLRVILNYQEWGVIDTTSFIYNVNNNSITYLHQARRHVAQTELQVFKQVLSSKTNPFKNRIPGSIRRSIAFKYLQISLYYREIKFFGWYCRSLLRESLA